MLISRRTGLDLDQEDDVRRHIYGFLSLSSWLHETASGTGLIHTSIHIHMHAYIHIHV